MVLVHSTTHHPKKYGLLFAGSDQPSALVLCFHVLLFVGYTLFTAMHFKGLVKKKKEKKNAYTLAWTVNEFTSQLT